MSATSQAESQLAREGRWVSVLLPTLALAGATGLSTDLAPGHSYWQQWTNLLHVLAGLALILCLPLYWAAHWRRILGRRRPAALATGAMSAIPLLALAGSGVHMLIVGQTEALRWVHQVHWMVAYGALTALVIHLLAHAVSKDRVRVSPAGRFRTLERTTIIATLVAPILAGSVVAGLSASSVGQVTLSPAEPAALPYELPYGDHPFRPSETETGHGGFVPAEQIAGSDTCGACHPGIFDQWRSSLHAKAASDPAYVSNIELLAEDRGMAATRYCEGCHAPVALLSGELTDTGHHGGVAGTRANREGVGCMGCHGIERAVHLKGVASYEYRPATGYLFAHDQAPLAVRLHNLLIRIHPDQHRREMSRPVLETPQLCATCHVQFMPESLNHWGWVKLQDEYSAWLASPYSGQQAHDFATAEMTRCQDCHMPVKLGSDPSADASGRLVSHRTLGANTAIPWYQGNQEQFLREQAFLRSGRLYVSIDQPWREAATQDGQYVDESIRGRSETPGYFYLGEKIRLQVTVTNARVGHDFPGGTIDINEAWIALRVQDAEDRTLFESGGPTGDGRVDPNAHFYRAVAVDRHGRMVWRHDLFNMVGNSYEKTVPSGASDVVEYAFAIPAWSKGPMTVTAILRHRKLNNRYARWALGDPGLSLPVTELARDSLVVPIRVRPQVRR